MKKDEALNKIKVLEDEVAKLKEIVQRPDKLSVYDMRYLGLVCFSNWIGQDYPVWLGSILSATKDLSNKSKFKIKDHPTPVGLYFVYSLDSEYVLLRPKERSIENDPHIYDKPTIGLDTELSVEEVEALLNK